MTVTPLESKPSDDANAPFYQDENIQVFTAPISPTSPIASTVPETEPHSLKRKLPSSFDGPDADAKRLQTVATGEEKSLQELMKATDFLPELLSGASAEEYRRTIIGGMFGTSKARAKNNGQDADSVSRPTSNSQWSL